jgi:hypothetical protein
MSNYTASIEDYPHVVNKLCSLWGQPELFTYLDGLVTTERADARTGFPLGSSTNCSGCPISTAWYARTASIPAYGNTPASMMKIISEQAGRQHGL